MIELQSIESLDLPELAPYRTMRRQVEQRQQGIFVAEGEKVVRRLLASKFPVVSLLMPDKWLPQLEPEIRSRPETIKVFLGKKELLETMTGFTMYQGLLAVGKVPEAIGLENLIEHSLKPLLLVAADGISNAPNLGVLIRNCAAFKADGLIAGETTCSPFLRRAVRTSMGTIFQLPVVETSNLLQ